MIDHALLQTNFAGRDGFVWWIGKVADPQYWRDGATDVEQGWPFRCKVRIIGYHPFDETELKEEDLPWAHVMVPAHSGAGQGCLGDSSRMVGGETVFGFFMDGEEGQQPVVFGALQRSLKGPTNVSADAKKREKGSAFSPLSGRKAGGEGLTTQPPSKAQPAATPGKNSDNKAGTSDADNKKEGLRRHNAASQVFANLGYTHTASNACENDSISKITHAIGSFLKTVNSLTLFAQTYIDAAQNLVADIRRILTKTTRLIVGAVKWLVNAIRDKVMCLLGKRFRDFIGLVVPEPQKSPVIQALKRIMDIIFCVLEKLGFSIGDFIFGLLKDLIGKTINTAVCAIEQTLATILAKLNDALMAALKPILQGLDWLTGALGTLGGILGKVTTYINMIMSFLSCDALQCKDYDDWSQGWGLSTKTAQKMSSVLDNIKVINDLDAAAGDGDLSFLSMLGGNLSQFFDCNNKVQNPQTQDDLTDTIPPGFIFESCIPPTVNISGNAIKPAKVLPVVASDGSILTIRILDGGYGYETAPNISVIDKTHHGGGALAKTKIDDQGRLIQIFMVEKGEDYCPTTGSSPNTPPSDESDGGDSTDTGGDSTGLDTSPPYITFTTPSDDAVGVQTSISLSVSFNESIRRGAGVIILRESRSNDVHEIIPVDDNRITFISDKIIRIDPDRDLKFETEYFITMSRGSFVDESGNKFAGIARTDTYNFTTRPSAGIGSEPVGIVTDVVPWRPGIGYTDGDTGSVGGCTFNLVLTPAGSVVGITDLKCPGKFNSIPDVVINTNTGRGAELKAVLAYSPDFTRDTGIGPDPQTLVINVVDCVGK